MRFHWLWGLLLVTLGASVWPPERLAAAAGRPEVPAAPATLAACIDRALERSPRLALAHAAARAADTGVDLARSAGGLHAALSGEVRGTTPTPLVQIPGQEPREVIPALDASLGLAIEVPLDVGRRLRSERRAAQAGADAAWARYEQARDQLVFEVVRAYYGVLQADAFRDATAAAVDAAEESRRVTRARVAAGMANDLESQRADTALAKAREQLALAESRAAEARAALATVIGMPGAPVGELQIVFLEPDRIPDPEESIARAQAERPELAAALADLRQAASRLRAADAADRPAWALSGGVKAQRASLIRVPFAATIGLGFTWPFGDHGRADALVDQAEASRDGARSAVADTAAAIELQVQQSVLAIADARSRIDSAMMVRTEAEQALAEAEAAERRGASLPMGTLRARASLAEAVALERASRYALSVAYAAWARSTGATAEVFLTAGPPEG
ncbi:MAG TPA: TolC family protein [Armatimonadota bacterium]|nr:TolC family protein [Armatimonadota bacterium]